MTKFCTQKYKFQTHIKNINFSTQQSYVKKSKKNMSSKT